MFSGNKTKDLKRQMTTKKISIAVQMWLEFMHSHPILWYFKVRGNRVAQLFRKNQLFDYAPWSQLPTLWW